MGESDDYALLSALREADWVSARSLVESGDLTWATPPLPQNVPARLVELNAPATLVVASLLRWAGDTRADVNRTGLLEACMLLSRQHSNAFSTFSSLLSVGLSANAIADGGATLLQRAMELNLVCEVQELLRHGVEADQMSVFGRESTSNLEEARVAANKAGDIVLEHFLEARSCASKASDASDSSNYAFRLTSLGGFDVS